MSGECDKCGNHALECVCVLHAFDCECEVCKDKWEKAQAVIDAILIKKIPKSIERQLQDAKVFEE